jgi:hypothetical protein
MSKITDINICPTDAKKQYIVPTINWLEPIKELITNDIGTEGLLIISKLIKKEKVIVKITFGYNKKIKVFNNLLKNEKHNLIKTYCVFTCYENEKTLSNKYKDSNDFCNGTSEDQLILLEIMKKYEGSLSSYEGNLNFNTYMNVLKQIILIQIYLFEKYGIVHNDLHNGNILIKRHSHTQNFEYKISNKTIAIDSKIEFILSDFGYAVSYDENIFNKYDDNFLFDKKINKLNVLNFNENFTLSNNILSVINNSLNLLNVDDRKNEIF